MGPQRTEDAEDDRPKYDSENGDLSELTHGNATDEEGESENKADHKQNKSKSSPSASSRRSVWQISSACSVVPRRFPFAFGAASRLLFSRINTVDADRAAVLLPIGAGVVGRLDLRPFLVKTCQIHPRHPNTTIGRSLFARR